MILPARFRATAEANAALVPRAARRVRLRGAGSDPGSPPSPALDMPDRNRPDASRPRSLPALDGRARSSGERPVDDRHFVVEMDDDGVAWLRFGKGGEGEMPDAGTSFAAHYGVGNGPAGNVGAETLLTIVFRRDGYRRQARSAQSSCGDRRHGPGTVAEARVFAPHAFRDSAGAGDHRRRLRDPRGRRCRRRDERARFSPPLRHTLLPSLPGPADTRPEGCAR